MSFNLVFVGLATLAIGLTEGMMLRLGSGFIGAGPELMHSRLFEIGTLKEVWNGSTGTRLCWNGYGNPPDAEANRYFQIMEKVDRFFQNIFGRLPVGFPHLMRIDIHHSAAFNQVLWHKEEQKVLYGDFSPEIFSASFAANAELITHAFGEAMASSYNLGDQCQSRAIEASLADVFTVTEKHHRFNVFAQSPDASWNIGDHLIHGTAQGDSLRSMSHPGSGYRDHPILGSDDQVGHMQDYHETLPDQDLGGFRKYSGIANRAFYLAATQEGGPSWERMGKIWHRALTHSWHNIGFAGFARETVTASRDLEFGEPIAHIVASSWSQVGVNV